MNNGKSFAQIILEMTLQEKKEELEETVRMINMYESMQEEKTTEINDLEKALKLF